METNTKTASERPPGNRRRNPRSRASHHGPRTLADLDQQTITERDRAQQVVASVQTISEAHLLPVIEQMLAQFPFSIIGFHADNGSEYVNHRVAKMLNRLRIEFTRSRPRHSNDNGLAETKNGAVVRKVFGYAHIPQRYAAQFNTFCREYLNPFLNFHRPCLFATAVSDPKKPGRIKRIYRHSDEEAKTNPSLVDLSTVV